MMELHFEKSTNTTWPVKALAQNMELVFSGNFSVKKVQQERIDEIFRATLRVLLWLILALGALSFLAEVWLSVKVHSLDFLILPSALNLALFLGIFAGLYLWAMAKQGQLQNSGINLLRWPGQEDRDKHQPLDVFAAFSKEAKTAWNNTVYLAQHKQQAVGAKAVPQILSVTANDLALSLLDAKTVQLAFWRLGVNTQDIKTLLRNYDFVHPGDSHEALSKLPFVAFTESLKLHNKNIDCLMLLCALAICLPQQHILQAIFFNIDLSVEKLEIIASWIFNLRLLVEDQSLFYKLAKFKPDNEINKGLTAVPTFYLDRFSKDLTFYAKHGALPLALGRGTDLHEIFKLISAGNRNLLIKGQAGTGRTTLVNELAYKMASDQVPKIWEDKRLVVLEISAILGQTGKAEQIFVHSLEEAAKSDNIILVIEDIHSLAQVQSSGGLNFLELLIDFLQNHNLMAIGTTTLEDYTDYLQTAANFNSVFTSYELSPLSKEGIMLACCIRASLLEGRNKCFFRYQAIEQAVDLTDLYLKGSGQPQKAISILVEAANRAKNSAHKIITPELIEKIISEKTHIPTQTFTQNEAEKLLHLEEEMSKFIVGQADAVTAVAEGLRRARSGLASLARPLASFLFLGPTGVGKTEVARVLAANYFGEEKYLLRLDMSEFRGPEGLDKLLGQPGKKLDPPLIKHIKNYPFCLLLLDEFEKASPEILNLFLQILEDGRLTSGSGEVLDLTHCLIIATSNAGSKEIQEGLKAFQTLEQLRQKLFNLVLINIFPPELLNRFDSIILFSPLSPEEVKKIALLQLQTLRQNLLQKGIKADFSDAVISDIAQNAFDPSLGARPIRRYIQDHLEGFVAKLLLAKSLPRGSNVMIDLENGRLTVKQIQ